MAALGRRGHRGRAARHALHRRVGGRLEDRARSACACRGGVSTHGLAVNVDNDLQPFEWIVPCGIDHVRVTSVSKETGRAPLAALLPQADGLAVRRGVRACGSGSCRERRLLERAAGGGMSTRSRANPGGARVLELMGEVRPFRERKPAWFKRPGAGRPALPRAARDDRERGPAHGLPGGGLPEHRRVLGARHRHVHDPRRHLHAPLRLLQRQDRASRPTTTRSSRCGWRSR